MTDTALSPDVEKICAIWSTRQERQIALQIRYSVSEEDGCKIYTLNHVQELK